MLANCVTCNGWAQECCDDLAFARIEDSVSHMQFDDIKDLIRHHGSWGKSTYPPQSAAMVSDPVANAGGRPAKMSSRRWNQPFVTHAGGRHVEKDATRRIDSDKHQELPKVAVEFYSEAHNDWLPATITDVDADGRIMLDIKPNVWLTHDLQATLVRLPQEVTPVPQKSTTAAAVSILSAKRQSARSNHGIVRDYEDGFYEVGSLERTPARIDDTSDIGMLGAKVASCDHETPRASPRNHSGDTPLDPQTPTLTPRSEIVSREGTSGIKVVSPRKGMFRIIVSPRDSEARSVCQLAN
mmetsp:Transcript_8696/g.14106  ORF Transcript_8696/g.14106 Transcript_8696/m.14106 type:complete len:297 (+) Transcript_8696:93-983(+)